ncbi:universal stress protein [Streptomyces gilvus]|uniref:universal stress protein n=1 Tax=Streptomyces gilvus TaxID=2920937 RepID=UPI001F0DA4B1|nr:universal stress protein [Streptomyces sp. CME 23]MCH5671923.1 universal stress protein [Streptomyces sp. CME 23]
MTAQHVAVGVDGSLIAVRALDLAAEEAVRRGATLRVVYAVSDRDEAAPILAAAAERIRDRHPGLPFETEAAEDDPVRALARESAGAALTVVGTRGLGTVGGTLFGSVSLRLAAHTHGPLMIVRGDHPCGDDRAVLLGLESDADAEAAAHAFEAAERRAVRLRVLHTPAHRHTAPELPSPIPATSPGQRRQAQEERAEEAVSRFGIARLRQAHPSVTVDTGTVRTGPAHALLDATRECAVVVIGRHRHLGPVAHTLLHRSHCPVVLVPATD